MHLDHMQIFTFFFETCSSLYVAQRDHELIAIFPASECQVPGLQACTTLPTSMQMLGFTTH